MKHEWIKELVGKLAVTGTTLLFLVLVPATAAGSVPLWAALLIGAVGVLALNAVCGVLLADKKTDTTTLSSVPAPQVSLRVVRGGRAA